MGQWQRQNSKAAAGNEPQNGIGAAKGKSRRQAQIGG